MRNLSKLLILPILFFFGCSPSFSQIEKKDILKEEPAEKEVVFVENDTSATKLRKQSFFDFLVGEEEVINATLTTDLSKLEDPRNRENWWDGQFALQMPSGIDSLFDVEVRLRGMFRLITCDFPPLKLKFKKKGLKKSGLRKRYNKLKLVTHCMEDSEQSEDLIKREYLAYKLFNILNENSFRVKLVQMKYINSEKKRDKRRGLGVLIEDSKEVADRIGGKATDAMGIKDSLFNEQQERMTSLFQYMISNTDWNNYKNRNVKLIETDEDAIFSVPYDFDFSGFVSAPYARLTREFGQESLKDRVFLGNAKSMEELQPTIDIFLKHKTEILDEIQNFKLLRKSSRRDLRNFIKEFYETLEDREKFEASIFKKE